MAIHDDTDQSKLFGYFSYIYDDTSRLTLLVSGNHSDFQVPPSPPAKVFDSLEAARQGSTVTSTLARAVVVLALCLSIGPHWVVLQSVAWGTMVVGYSQHGSLSQAIAQTFDGDHPCNLCKRISTARNSEKKGDALPASVKPDLICATRRIPSAASLYQFHFCPVGNKRHLVGEFSTHSAAAFRARIAHAKKRGYAVRVHDRNPSAFHRE